MLLTGLVTLLTMMVLSPGREQSKADRYPQVERPAQKDRILIVAPHIDDEAIGAGGYAADALAGGAEVYVVFLTAGDCNRISARLLHKTLEPTPSNFLSVGRTRIAEAGQAMAALGVPKDHFFVLGYPDRGLQTILRNPNAIVRSIGTRENAVPYAQALSPGAPYTLERLKADVARVVTITQPTIVIAPVPFDRHPDHSAAAAITDIVLADLNLRPQRLGYLVHSAWMMKSWVPRPNGALLPPARMQAFSWATYPLSPRAQKTKDRVLRTYKSQRPYVFLLRNQFVRTNELFFIHQEATAAETTYVPVSNRPDWEPAR
ncbi:MAG TPA: PIG-L family deacetylase [Thermoanaerobaculia bacterium]|nr:PIG-L family deacetylase [Thermoanaerobaculia bacterium]